MHLGISLRQWWFLKVNSSGQTGWRNDQKFYHPSVRKCLDKLPAFSGVEPAVYPAAAEGGPKAPCPAFGWPLQPCLQSFVLGVHEANNVNVVSCPPHTMHTLQPGDRLLFQSLKHQWQELGCKWTRRTSGKKLPKQLFFSVFTPA